MASQKILPRNLAGPQVRRVRVQQGLTQQALAERCQRAGWDLSRDTLAKVEGQTRWLADFELTFLAGVLRVPLEVLLPEPGRARTKTVSELLTRLSGGREV